MRHQAEHVARAVADAGDAVHRAVGIRLFRDLARRVRVAQQHLSVFIQLFQGGGVGVVAAFAVLDRHLQQFAGLGQTRERGAVVLDPEVHSPAHETQRGVTGQGSREQPRFAKDLESVADAEHQSARLGEVDDALHDGREASHGAGPQVVAVGEAAGQHHAVAAAGERVLVPEGADILPEHVAQAVDDVVVVAGTGKDGHSPTHAAIPGSRSGSLR